jgi:hypothetical protein
MSRFVQGRRIDELYEGAARAAGLLLGKGSVIAEATDAVIVEGHCAAATPSSPASAVI